MSGERDKIILTITNQVTGEDVEHQLPTKHKVCPGCEGRGTHVNPNVDGNGITPEQFAEDPDFEESYLRGDYDVQCQTCNGLRVVPVVDEDRCPKTLLEAYQRQEQQKAQWDAEERAERRWEAYAMGEKD